MLIDLNRLEPWSPFQSRVWHSMRSPIQRKEIDQAVSEGRLKGFDENLWQDESRSSHIERIAYLVVHGWDDPISIDVGIPFLGCYVDWIIVDGNHRLAAAFYRNDTHIDVGISGCNDYIKELLGVDFNDETE